MPRGASPSRGELALPGGFVVAVDDLRVAVWTFFFLGTGIATTLSGQFLVYAGAAKPATLFLPLSTYLGMLLVYFFPPAWLGMASIPVVSQGAPSPLSSSSPPGAVPVLGAGGGSAAATEGLSDSDEDTAGGADDISDDPSAVALGPRAAAPPAPALGLLIRAPAPSSASPGAPAAALPAAALGSASAPPSPNAIMWTMTAFDIVGCIACNAGFVLLGSGLFQVLYSSVVIWAALASWLYLRVPQSLAQWLGILTVVSGLAGAVSNVSLTDDGGMLFFGVVFSFGGAACYGANYVAGELIAMANARGGQPPTSPAQICGRVGLTGTALLLVYVGVYVLPVWTELVAAPMAAAAGSPAACAVAYAGNIASHALHNVAYFRIIGRLGSVSTGMITCVRAVGVFFVSHPLFCQRQAVQCLSTRKVVATLVVAAGVLLYSRASAEAKKARAAEQERLVN